MRRPGPQTSSLRAGKDVAVSSSAARQGRVNRGVSPALLTAKEVLTGGTQSRSSSSTGGRAVPATRSPFRGRSKGNDSGGGASAYEAAMRDPVMIRHFKELEGGASSDAKYKEAMEDPAVRRMLQEMEAEKASGGYPREKPSRLPERQMVEKALPVVHHEPGSPEDVLAAMLRDAGMDDDVGGEEHIAAAGDDSEDDVQLHRLMQRVGQRIDGDDACARTELSSRSKRLQSLLRQEAERGMS
eukprot:TRINITY_DN122472_c0_g1_i1.p1 TRINITY_DN122472_c0_g1~~TRINITY_DN122472_c0_g1_i1.p1  ORF type:complete len:242 (-),score=44.35 TRINITY_DN122472_c0_g1_i1:450-1175(-)